MKLKTIIIHGFVLVLASGCIYTGKPERVIENAVGCTSNACVYQSQEDRLLDDAIEANDMSAFYRLALQGSQRSVAELLKRAEQNNSEAQYFSARVFENQLAGFTDAAQGIKWYERAHQNGHPNAAYDLAKFYFSGKVMAKNFEQAFKWSQIAAEADKKEAAYLLAQLYERGLGTTENLEAAKQWYQKAADGGIDGAKLRLAKLFERTGETNQQDPGKSFRLYLSAAEDGNSQAQLIVAKMYYEGKGTTVNKDEALKWARTAADAGELQAQIFLAQLLSELE